MMSSEQVPDGSPLYAVVVVHTPLGRKVTTAVEIAPDDDEQGYLTRAFHYSVPARLSADIHLGQLVWVPFGARYLQGVIVRFDDRSPVEETRDIDQIVDAEPVLSPLHIELAHWISEHYLAPIQQVIPSMLPPGVTQKTSVVVEIMPQTEPMEATQAQAALLALLREKGALTQRQIARQYKGQNWRSLLDQLVRRGWAGKRVEIQPPQVRPKLVSIVCVAPGTDPDALLPKRATKQRQAMEYLLSRQESGSEWIPQEEIREDTGVAASIVRALADKGLVEIAKRQIWRDPLRRESFVPVIPPRLTPAQESAWGAVAQDLEQPAGHPFLLHGVTGSGKTEIYLRAVQRALEQGRGAIVLVPEIALTPQTIRRFGARFPMTIAVMHSHLSPGERYDQWRRLRAGDLRLVVGSRSAIFAPVRDLGLIVLDEEHEWSYKQERTPNYHARDVAVHLARLAGATTILGSATPDLESVYRAKRGEYVYLTLPQRVMGHRKVLQRQAIHLQQRHTQYRPVGKDLNEAMYAELPPVEIVDMRAELKSGNTNIFSRSLKTAMDQALGKGEQIILFLNRRGAATFVMCRDCGHVMKCPRCDVPLTYHSSRENLICHHCNYQSDVPKQCPACHSHRIKFFGIGTQRVEQLVQQTYPQARIVRWDLDTTGGKLSHEQLLDRFIKGEADIMIGTQMIAKGLDLPRVTLVGVITADTIINLPDFRSGERTFQLLTQVSGRAGRSILGGKVIIQTYTPQHYAIRAAAQHDYDAFYEQEIAFRREHWYPPLSHLVRLIYLHPNAEAAQREAEHLHRILSQKIARLGLPEVDLIGPAPAFFARVRGRWRWQIIVRGTKPSSLLQDIHLPLGWRVDVDPVSTL
jgi:primosomal protein N' (replication factor Y)